MDRFFAVSKKDKFAVKQKAAVELQHEQVIQNTQARIQEHERSIRTKEERIRAMYEAATKYRKNPTIYKQKLLEVNRERELLNNLKQMKDKLEIELSNTKQIKIQRESIICLNEIQKVQKSLLSNVNINDASDVADDTEDNRVAMTELNEIFGRGIVSQDDISIEELEANVGDIVASDYLEDEPVISPPIRSVSVSEGSSSRNPSFTSTASAPVSRSESPVMSFSPTRPKKTGKLTEEDKKFLNRLESLAL